jgi:hypothetical protein
VVKYFFVGLWWARLTLGEMEFHVVDVDASVAVVALGFAGFLLHVRVNFKLKLAIDLNISNSSTTLLFMKIQHSHSFAKYTPPSSYSPNLFPS